MAVGVDDHSGDENRLAETQDSLPEQHTTIGRGLSECDTDLLVGV